MDVKKLLAEAIGSFILVGIGSLSIISAVYGGAPVVIVAPFGFGLGLLAAIAVSGHVSGGHYNPAVTLAALLDKRIDVVGAIGYVVAQVIGAAAASLAILVIASRDAVLGTKNVPGGGVTDIQAFATEVLLTAIFIAVILTATKKAASHAGFLIPLTLVVVHFAGIPISGASVNPARALGPALVGTNLASIWIYLTAPFVGAVVGWVAYRLLADD